MILEKSIQRYDVKKKKKTLHALKLRPETPTFHQT